MRSSLCGKVTRIIVRQQGRARGDKAVVAGVSESGPRMPRAGTKLAALVALLDRKEARHREWFR
jgi:hypothetical protein